MTDIRKIDPDKIEVIGDGSHGSHVNHNQGPFYKPFQKGVTIISGGGPLAWVGAFVFLPIILLLILAFFVLFGIARLFVRRRT